MADVEMESRALANGQAGDGSWATRSVEGWIIIVTGLNEETTEDDLQDLFADHGEVKNLSMALNRRTGYVMGYALVEYALKEEAEKAIKATDGTEFLEKTIRTLAKHTAPPRGARPSRDDKAKRSTARCTFRTFTRFPVLFPDPSSAASPTRSLPLSRLGGPSSLDAWQPSCSPRLDVSPVLVGLPNGPVPTPNHEHSTTNHEHSTALRQGRLLICDRLHRVTVVSLGLDGSMDTASPASPSRSVTTDLPTGSPEYEGLIASLRASLSSTQTLLQTQATRLSTLSDVQTELSQLKDQLTFVAAAKEAVEAQLQEEKKKREVAEENVELLRGQVEQARKGFMALQKQDKERKRYSQIGGPGLGGLGLAGTSSPGEEEGGGGETGGGGTSAVGGMTKAARRQSMMARGHRRVSSQSEENMLHPVSNAPPTKIAPSAESGATRTGGLRELKLGQGPIPPVHGQSITSPTSAHTGFFEDPAPIPGPAAPVMADRTSSNTQASSPKVTDSSVVEEATRLRNEMAGLQLRLAESEEARQASETCLKALREFMAGGGDASAIDGEDAETNMAELLKGIRLPPLPTDRDPDAPEAPSTKDKTLSPGGGGGAGGSAAAGWGFNLFKTRPNPQGSLQGPPSPALSTQVEPPLTPHPIASPALSGRSSITPSLPVLSPGEQPTEGKIEHVPVSQTPLAGLVGGWTRGVSPGTPQLAPPPPPNSRKISSFFGLAGRKDKERGVGVKEGGKDLPSVPESAANEAAGQKEREGLQPPAEIEDDGVDEVENEGERRDTGATVGREDEAEVKGEVVELDVNGSVEAQSRSL